MISNKGLHGLVRIFKGLLVAVLVLSFAASGLLTHGARSTTLHGIFAPYIVKYAAYQESMGLLDQTFIDDGWLLTNYSGSLDFGYAILAQPDGRLLVAGSFEGTSQDFGLARFNADGSLDTTFDGDGRVHTDFLGSADEARAIALQTDGKIILAGSAYNNLDSRDEFALARYTSLGVLDPDFGYNGLVITDFLGGPDVATAIEIQSDGKIVVAGYAWSDYTYNYEFAVARYDSAGVLDPSFDIDGKVITDCNNKSNKAYALVLVGDKLVVAGEANNGSNLDFALVRYNANGSPDSSFGSAGTGIVLTDFAGSVDSGRDIVRQPDGKLILAGYGTLGDNIDFALARYDADGALDKNFDSDGKVTTDIFGGQDYGQGILLQSDNKLVVTGYVFDGQQNDFALARYSSAGALDNNFDSDGKVYTDFDGRSEWAYGLVRQADDRLVVAGYTLTVAGSDFALARYTTAGALDTDFSEDGWVVMNLYGSSDQAFAAAIAPDDKLVLAGSVEDSTGSDFAVARFDPDGHPDLSFDLDGRNTSDFYDGYDYAYAALVQPDGKIVLAGSTYSSSTATWNDFALVRYDVYGSLDPTFSDDGWTITDYAEDDDCIYAIIRQADGKLVVAGAVGTATAQDFALARFNPNGSLDTTFGSGGWTTTDFFGADDKGLALFQQENGLLVVAGYAENGASTDFAVARYTSNGAPDTTFGAGGKVTTSFGSYDDAASAVIVQSDEKIVVAGWSNNGTENDIALARYTSTGVPDPGFGGSGKVITNISTGGDLASAIGLQPDGKLVVAGKASTTTGYDIVLLRYRPDGSLDDEFSDDGWLTLDFYGGDDSARALLMLTTGRLVVAGNGDNGTDFDFALARFR